MKGPRFRPSAIWRSGAATVLPFAALALSGSAAAGAPFAPPASPLLLTRVLHSPLADGKEVVARRTYEVRIVPTGAGFRVEGRQIAVDVQAPEPLKALADIERNRADAAVVSFALDAQGLIVPNPPQSGSEAFDRAAEHAAGAIERSQLPEAQRQAARGFVGRLQDQPVATAWPADLFHPAVGRRIEKRSVALPDGSEGHVIVEIAVSGAGPDGRLHAMARTVVTEIGSTRRITREEWTLAAGR